MRRIMLALSMVLTAATLACILLFVVPEDSLAAAPPSKGGPSQGTFTEGRAGPNEPSLVADTPPSTYEADGAVYGAASGTRQTGRDVVIIARWHLGTPYRHSPPHPCRARRSEDCSCHTKLVFGARSIGIRLADSPVRQYNRGRWIARSNLRRGDLVFFKENGRRNPITHVGIYSGNGNLIHASNYFGKVVESKMRYIEGYHGAKRLRLN
jgi:cell wall-associated NlpC family hydrolase